MRRPTPHGTPWRSSRYWRRDNSGRLLRSSIAGGLIALAVGITVFFFVSRSLASPGPVAAGHLNAGSDCAQCHTPLRAADDIRCERCHDPIDSRRFAPPAHAATGGEGAWRMAHVDQMNCAVCHSDHQGVSHDLSRVADGRCVECHDFGSFKRHPEFAAVRATVDSSAGMDFSHEIHLREIAKTGGDRCQACHQPAPDGRAFEPIAFDTHCTKCHLLQGALTLNGTDLLKSGWMLASALPPAGSPWPAPRQLEADDRGRVMLDRFTHRDPWVLAAADRLARVIAGPALMASLASRDALADRLSGIAQTVPIGGLSDADLAGWQATLDTEISTLDTMAAGSSTDGFTALATLMASVDPSLSPLASQFRAAAAAQDAEQARPADAQQIEDRRREIEQLLAAITSRTTGAQAERAAELTRRLAEIKAESAAPAPPDSAAVRDRVNAVDAAVRTVEGAAGPIASAEIRGLSNRVGGRVQDETRAAQRAQLMALLDSQAPRAAPLQRARIAELRMLSSLVFDEAGSSAQAVRGAKARLRDRVALEQSLRAGNGVAPVDAVANRERTEASRTRQFLAARAAAFAVRPPWDAASATLTGIEPGRAKSSLKGLLGACLSCHRLDHDEAAMRPMSAGRPMLTSAAFSHKPHLLQAKCETCHASVTTSKAGADVNLPGVASCQECHQSSRARSDCVSCHRYHPRSAAELLTLTQ